MDAGGGDCVSPRITVNGRRSIVVATTAASVVRGDRNVHQDPPAISATTAAAATAHMRARRVPRSRLLQRPHFLKTRRTSHDVQVDRVAHRLLVPGHANQLVARRAPLPIRVRARIREQVVELVLGFELRAWGADRNPS